jgi:hypothetical protein
LLSCMIYALEAKATIVIPPPYAPYQTNLGAWDADPYNAVLQQDKKWKFVSASANLLNPALNPLNPAPVRFDFADIGGIERHILTLGDSSNAYKMLEGVYDLHYTIEVYNSPGRFIDSATLDVDTGGTSGVTVTKTLKNQAGATLGVLVSTGGPVSTSFATTFLDVVEQIVVGPGGAVFSTTDTYTQSAVPEPLSIVVWSLLGGVGVVIAYRRRKR